MRFNLVDRFQTAWMGCVLFALFLACLIRESGERYLMDKSIGSSSLPRMFSSREVA